VIDDRLLANFYTSFMASSMIISQHRNRP